VPAVNVPLTQSADDAPPSQRPPSARSPTAPSSPAPPSTASPTPLPHGREVHLPGPADALRLVRLIPTLDAADYTHAPGTAAIIPSANMPAVSSQGTFALAAYGSLVAGADWHMSSNSPRPGSSPPAPRSTPYLSPLVLAVMYAPAPAQPKIEVTCQVPVGNRVDPIPFSQHLHHQIGNTSTTNSSTDESLCNNELLDLCLRDAPDSVTFADPGCGRGRRPARGLLCRKPTRVQGGIARRLHHERTRLGD
jgi:hypothetical protein